MKKIVSLLFVGLVGMQAAIVNAETLVRPRASLGFASYELEFVDTATVFDPITYMTLGVGATFAMDDLYLDASITTALGASYDFGATAPSDEDFFRNDIAFTAGLLLNDGLSVFGGIKIGQTEFDNPYSGATVLTFDSNGIFGGASKTIPMGQNALSVKASLAIMGGELSDDAGYSTDGDTFGFSIGATYSINFSADNGMMVRGGYQSYSFVDFDDGSTSDTTERIISADVVYFMNF